MGIGDYLGGLLPHPDLNDPNTLGLLAAGLKLFEPVPKQLGTGGAIAQAGQTGLQTLMNARDAQRKSQQEELSTLAATYKILKEQDDQAQANALFTGQPYKPNPLLAQHEARLAKLLGGPVNSPAPMTNGLLGNSTPQPQPSGLLSPSNPPQQIASADGTGQVDSLGRPRLIDPNGNNPRQSSGPRDMGAPQFDGNGNQIAPPTPQFGPAMLPRLDSASTPSVPPMLPPNAGAMPQPQGPVPNVQPPSMGQPPQDRLPTIPEMVQGAGIDPRMAAIVWRTPQGQRSIINKLAETYGPRVVNNVLMQYTPQGQTKFLGGVVSKDSVPVTTDAQGNPQLRPIPGAIDYFAGREGAITGAQEDAKAARDLVQLPQPDGTVRYVTRSQAIAMTGQPSGSVAGIPPPSNGNYPTQIPPDVQAARDAQRLQILMAERARQAQTGQVDPNLEREIQFAQRGVNFTGQQPNGPGFGAGQSTAQKAAAETNPKLQLEALAKSYEDTNKVNDSLMFVDAARRAVNGATTTGLFAKPALLAARVGSAFGITDPAAAADPEVFMAMAGRQVMGVIKSLGSGSGISDSDRVYAAKAMGGDITLNQESINRLLDIQERATRRLVDLHNKRVDQAAESGVPSVFSYRIEPLQPSGGGANVVTLPNGRTVRFPNEAKAQQFKREAGM